MTKPRLLDLFCGAGGAAVGYYRAGFDVVGVDIADQPNFPFPFIRADALELGYRGFDAIHASPPCQRYTIAQNARGNRDLHPDLIAPTRELLERTGLPWVMENVAGAPLADHHVILCGTSFGLGADGFELRRHRLFEATFPILVPKCRHDLPAAPVFGHNPNGDFMKRYGRGFDVHLRRKAMGIDWMNRDELREAIPPAFTEHIGAFLLEHLERAAA